MSRTGRQRRRAAVAAAALAITAGCGEPTGPGGPVALPETFIDVAAGDFHSCAVGVDGTAYCWGSNGFGQLGSDGVEYTAWPRPVAGPAFVSITAGYAHTCGIAEGGQAYCWGMGGHGQLGDGDHSNRAKPTPVAGDLKFLQLSGGRSHTCGLADDLRVYCWGSNSARQLGTGSKEPAAVPAAVAAGGITFHAVAAGVTHTCAIDTSGSMYCWGSNERAQLGLGRFEPAAAPTAISGTDLFAGVTAGNGRTCGVTTSGQALCWGTNEGGALGNASDAEFSGTPTAVAGSSLFYAVSLGSDVTACGIAGDARLYCWGTSSAGELGGGELQAVSRVPALADAAVGFADVAVGLRHACGLADGGRVYCWGANGAGQLGRGTFEDAASPAPVAGER